MPTDFSVLDLTFSSANAWNLLKGSTYTSEHIRTPSRGHSNPTTAICLSMGASKANTNVFDDLTSSALDLQSASVRQPGTHQIVARSTAIADREKCHCVTFRRVFSSVSSL